MSTSNYRKIKSKRKRKRIIRRFIILIVIVAVLAVAGGLAYYFITKGNDTSGSQTETTDTSAQDSTEDEAIAVPESGDVDIALGSNINIINIGSYLGNYVEDGSDEYVDDVMMITVENRGEDNLQLADVVINGTYQFELTTLLPGEKMMVLEKDRQAYDSNLTIESVELNNVAVFQEEPSLHEDMVSFTTADNSIVVKNVSKETTPEGKVFYKNHLEDGTLLGGITYCGSIPSLESGEEVTLTAGHYTVDNSQICFVTFGE